jgi:hypothetical protein
VLAALRDLCDEAIDDYNAALDEEQNAMSAAGHKEGDFA